MCKIRSEQLFQFLVKITILLLTDAICVIHHYLSKFLFSCNKNKNEKRHIARCYFEIIQLNTISKLIWPFGRFTISVCAIFKSFKLQRKWTPAPTDMDQSKFPFQPIWAGANCTWTWVLHLSFAYFDLFLKYEIS